MFVFLYFFEYILEWWKNLFPTKRMKDMERKKPIFTKRNRFIVSLMNKYGLLGISSIAPLLSIPLAAFIASRVDERYIQNKKKVLLYMCISMAIWSAVLTGLAGILW